MTSCVKRGANCGLGAEILAGKDDINFWLLKNEVYRGFTGPDEAPPARKHVSFTYNSPLCYASIRIPHFCSSVLAGGSTDETPNAFCGPDRPPLHL